MNVKVLVVEDDQDQLEAALSALRALGCVPAAAGDAEAGLELARGADFDVILTDNVLPGMSGLRSIAEYRKATPAPVLLMTSHYSEDFERDARLLGALRVFAKPLAWDELAAALSAYA